MLQNSYDAATGLLTRPAFEKRVIAAMAGAEPQAGHCVIYVDIDRLHVLNENHGMHVGGEVIARIADTIRRSMAPRMLAPLRVPSPCLGQGDSKHTMDPMSRAPVGDPLTGRTLLSLELLGIVLGAATFAIDPLNFIRPWLAVAGLFWMICAALIVRIVPSFRTKQAIVHLFEIVALFVFAVLMTASTGATSSPFLSFYALPIVASALLWKPWHVLLLAVAVVLVTLVQSGLLDAMNDMYFLTTAAVALNVLAPAFAAALILAGFRGRMGATELRIAELAATDGLTGLLNLQAFEQLMEQHHRESERSGHAYSLLVLGVDGLRQMNESLGHEAGSQIIVAVAKAIGRSIRATDRAARMGGDVFVVLLGGADQATANGIAQRIRNNVYNGTLQVENRMVRATVSIGVATYPKDEQTSKALMIQADQRMEQDKALRRPTGR
ncbi:MAG: diguanylate cyclase [Steroidobacteraceae bacterium]